MTDYTKYTDSEIIKKLPRVKRDGNFVSTVVIIQQPAFRERVKELIKRGFVVAVVQKCRGYYDPKELKND